MTPDENKVYGYIIVNSNYDTGDACSMFEISRGLKMFPLQLRPILQQLNFRGLIDIYPHEGELYYLPCAPDESWLDDDLHIAIDMLSGWNPIDR